METLGGLIYVAGGYSNDLDGYSNRLYAYNPATDAWTRKADLPYTCESAIMRAAGGKLYFIGGQATGVAFYQNCYEYDPAANTWTKKTDMPTAREDYGSAVVNDKIYCFGGLRSGPTAITTLEIFDPANNTWDETKADLPAVKILGDFGEALGGKVYAVDASNNFANYPTLNLTGTVYEYDPVGDAWATKANAMPAPRCYKEVVSVGDYLYVTPGATTNTGTFVKTMYRYDPVTDIWTQIDDGPYAARGVAACALNGSIYISGGYNMDGRLRYFYRIDL